MTEAVSLGLNRQSSSHRHTRIQPATLEIHLRVYHIEPLGHILADAGQLSTATRTFGADRFNKALDRCVPDTLRLVSRYDGLRAKLADPPLTAVNLHLERVAEVAVGLLIAMIEGEEPQSCETPLPALERRRSSA